MAPLLKKHVLVLCILLFDCQESQSVSGYFSVALLSLNQNVKLDAFEFMYNGF